MADQRVEPLVSVSKRADRLCQQGWDDVFGIRELCGAAAGRLGLGREQDDRGCWVLRVRRRSVRVPDGYAREHEAEGEMGGRGGSGRPHVSPAGEDVHSPVLDARGGALEQLLGIAEVVAPDEWGWRGMRAGHVVASSARWASELARWSGGNGGNPMCSRRKSGTADQS